MKVSAYVLAWSLYFKYVNELILKLSEIFHTVWVLLLNYFNFSVEFVQYIFLSNYLHPSSTLPKQIV